MRSGGANTHRPIDPLAILEYARCFTILKLNCPNYQHTNVRQFLTNHLIIVNNNNLLTRTNPKLECPVFPCLPKPSSSCPHPVLRSWCRGCPILTPLRPHSIELHGVSQGHPLSQAPPGTQLGSIQGRQRALPLLSPSERRKVGKLMGLHWVYLDIRG